MSETDRFSGALRAAYLAAAALPLLIAGGCGSAGSDKEANVVSCRSPDADRPVCVEYEPFDDNMRLVATTQCREAGGTAGSRCPTEGLVGICDKVVVAAGQKPQPWEFSRRNRSHHYAVPGAVNGPPDVARLKAECTAEGPRLTPGVWTDAKAGS